LAYCPTFSEWAAHLHVEPGRTIIHLEPARSSPETLIRQAQDSLTVNDFERALALAEEAYQLAPTEASAVLARALAVSGAALEKASRFENALADYHRALELSAPDSAFHRELGVVVAQVEKRLVQIAETKSLAKQARQFEVEGQWRQAMAVYTELTKRKTTAEQLSKWQEAWTRCREEVELADLFEKGSAAFASGQLNAAEELLTEVVRRRPRYEQNGKQAATILAQAIARGKARPKGWTWQERLIVAVLAVGVFLVFSAVWFVANSQTDRSGFSALGTPSATQVQVAVLDTAEATLTATPSNTPSLTPMASSTLSHPITSAPITSVPPTTVPTLRPSATPRPVLPTNVPVPTNIPPPTVPPPTVAPAPPATVNNVPVCSGPPTISFFVTTQPPTVERDGALAYNLLWAQPASPNANVLSAPDQVAPVV